MNRTNLDPAGILLRCDNCDIIRVGQHPNACNRCDNSPDRSNSRYKAGKLCNKAVE
jgi:hypothetical protein